MPQPTLLLIHGLGATAGVWAELQAELDWRGPVVTPELAGHGRAPWTGDYTIGSLAAGLSHQLEAGEEVVIVGHSLGGGVGLALASGLYRPRVRGVVGIGIKVSWTDDDVAQMAGVAGRGIRWFDTRDEAVTRFLRLAGLDGLVAPDHPAITTAVVEEDGRWRVSQDPMTFAQDPLDMATLMAAAERAEVPVVLGAGEHDALVGAADLAPFVAQPRIATERGHNVQVEDPAWVAGLLTGLELGS